MLDLREGLGKLCGRVERCIGRRYMAHAINTSKVGNTEIVVVSRAMESYYK